MTVTYKNNRQSFKEVTLDRIRQATDYVIGEDHLFRYEIKFTFLVTKEENTELQKIIIKEFSSGMMNKIIMGVTFNESDIDLDKANFSSAFLHGIGHFNIEIA